MTRFALCVVVLAACGGDSKTQDAATSDTASSSTVQMVTCPATPAATIGTSGSMYSPSMATITQGQIVKFMPAIEHDVEPGHTPADSTIKDSGLHVTFGGTACFMFTQPGMYGFHCGPHMFNGTITVQ